MSKRRAKYDFDAIIRTLGGLAGAVWPNGIPAEIEAALFVDRPDLSLGTITAHDDFMRADMRKFNPLLDKFIALLEKNTDASDLPHVEWPDGGVTEGQRALFLEGYRASILHNA